MNWMQSLYETYENCRDSIGYSSDATRPLLPICHITVQAHIEVVLDGNGNFRRAQIVDKDDSTTIIPATENSAGRTGKKPTCHPLSDSLQYLAGDFTDYGGEVTSGYASDPTEPYRKFIELLTDWCNSQYGHPKARIVLAYVQKKNLMRDLVAQRILLLDSNGKLQKKENAKRDKNIKDIFSVISSQDKAFVRWIIESPESNESRAWLDKTLWDSWSNYYLRSRTEKGLCMVTGREQLLTNNHPKYIRREGDNAKIISANDKRGFTFRGRFTDEDGAQACGVGMETSQKAHFALAWLISRQGYLAGDLCVVAWAVSGAKVPQPTEDTYEAFYASMEIEKDQLPADTAQDVGNRLRKKIAGYRQEIGERKDVVVMAVDTATESTARLSIVYYRALKGSEFLDRIESWHETCAWRHTYRTKKIQYKDTGKVKEIPVPFYGAPAPADIAEAAYGSQLDDKLKKTIIKRLLPCIVDAQPIPRDLVESVVRRASNRNGLSNYEWSKALTIACALYRKYKYGKEDYKMALDEKRTSRDYLYGRLLAIADVLEERTLSEAEKKRPTNATRYMQQFAQRPYSTWKQIHELLTPYFMRLGDGAFFYKWQIAQVADLFTPEDFVSNKPLSGEYLLGFYCQRQKMWEKKVNHDSENEKQSLF